MQIADPADRDRARPKGVQEGGPSPELTSNAAACGGPGAGAPPPHHHAGSMPYDHHIVRHSRPGRPCHGCALLAAGGRMLASLGASA